MTLDKLKVLTLHSNHLISLEMVSPFNAVMELVTLHDNRWRCSSETDCQWITNALDSFNKSAIENINAVNIF